MFTSYYQLIQEPHEAGVSIIYFKPGTHEVSTVIRTTVPMSCRLINLFNAAPENDQAASDWGIRADARAANKRLLAWLRGAGTSTDDCLRYAPTIRELAVRILEACAARHRLQRANRMIAAHQVTKQVVSCEPL